jgi:energy-converting hydrogenase Eha subunit B
VEDGGQTAALTFWAGNRLIDSAVNPGTDVNQGSRPMTFVNRLSVLTAYLAFAFVGAIVLGVI